MWSMAWRVGSGYEAGPGICSLPAEGRGPVADQDKEQSGVGQHREREAIPCLIDSNQFTDTVLK